MEPIDMIGRLALKIRQLGYPGIPTHALCWAVACWCCRSSRHASCAPTNGTWLRRAYLRNRGVEFALPCYFSQGFRLFRAGSLKIGPRSCFGENCGLDVHGDVTIGSDFVAAPGLTINNGTHDPETLQPSSHPIVIGDRVWCGVNVTIIAGARIGDDCVIGANSLVMHSIPPRSVAVGSPARIVRSNLRSAENPIVWSGYAPH